MILVVCYDLTDGRGALPSIQFDIEHFGQLFVDVAPDLGTISCSMHLCLLVQLWRLDKVSVSASLFSIHHVSNHIHHLHVHFCLEFHSATVIMYTQIFFKFLYEPSHLFSGKNIFAAFNLHPPRGTYVNLAALQGKSNRPLDTDFMWQNVKNVRSP